MKKSVAIVLARKNSKGIPNKNIFPICNKPLISYCLNALSLSKIDEYYVSTDSSLIADISKRYGAKIIDRPPELATDTCSSLSSLLYSVSVLKETPENILLVQPTSPLIIYQDINNIIDTLCVYDSALTVTKTHHFDWQIVNNKLIEKNHDFKNRKPRQLSSEVFSEIGSIYATKYINLINNKQILSNKIGYVNIPKVRSFQIDTYEDVYIIESLLKNKKCIIS